MKKLFLLTLCCLWGCVYATTTYNDYSPAFDESAAFLEKHPEIIQNSYRNYKEILRKARNGNTANMLIFSDGLRCIFADCKKKLSEKGGNIDRNKKELTDLYKESFYQSRYWLKKAAEMGNETAMMDWAREIRHGDDNNSRTEALKWYLKLAKRGYKEAMLTAGDLLIENKGGVTPNITEAVKWYTLADDPMSWAHLGKIYHTGQREVSKDIGKAIQYLNKVIISGSIGAINEASYDIGTIYYWGEGGVKRNLEEALRYLELSAEGQKFIIEHNLKSSFDTCRFNPNTPPILEIDEKSIKFVDSNDNNAIDAGEEISIVFNIKNKGKGSACQCFVKIKVQDPDSIREISSWLLEKLDSGETTEFVVPLKASITLPESVVTFIFQVEEPHGFGSDPVQLSVASRKFVAPKLEVVDYSISSNGNTLRKKTPFTLQFLLQNTLQGDAEDVTVNFSVPQGVLLLDGNETSLKFDRLEGGEVKTINYQLIASDKLIGNTIPIDIKVSEKYGLYAENKHIDLHLNQATTTKIVVEDKSSTGTQNIEVASLSSDVDKNIPLSVGTKSEKVFAVIIGNETYNKESNVPYATNDSKVFAEYCEKTLGLPKENIRLTVNATLNDLKHEIWWLKEVLKTQKGNAKAIFYYAGHGIPNEKTKTALLLPVDGYSNDVNTGYPLSDLFSELGNTPAKSIVVFLDACFSGSKRENGMLASSRGIAIKTDKGAPIGNMVVFSASQGDETAFPYKKEKHGMFTYFLLKSLKESKGEITLKQLSNFINDNVSQHSIIINSKPQTPSVVPSKTVNNVWENWKLK